MTKFIIRRLILGAFIIFFGSLVAYAVIRSLPTSFVERMARQLSSLPGAKSYTELTSQLNQMYGLDGSVLEGFFKWFGYAIRGEFGYSWKFNQPVIEKFNDVIWYSVVINIFTFILQAVICIPLGILAARKQYSATDYTVTVIALMGISLPTFFLATILKYIFSIKLGWFDLYGIVGRMHERYTRTNMLEVLNADYIRTARAKGLSEKVVINKHAFRNTLIPLISYMSYLLPSMFSGSMITETLFQIPGIGYISYQAITQGDIPFTMFYIVFIEVLTQFSLIIADISYAVADPRVRAN